MSAKVQLDRPHAHFTNLDFVTGRVILTLTCDEAVSSIVAKLEGESKTRLAGPKVTPNEGQSASNKTELEVHKILYQVQELFPSKEIRKQTSSTAGYTLAPGQHEYPFRFKLPFNNNCANTNSLLSNLNFSGMRMEIAKDPGHHLKRTLPPSMPSFPGEADIRYYVKATVIRPKFYQENRRAHSTFTFFPIEPPRPPPTDEETYARRNHTFPEDPAAAQKRKSLFTAFRASPATPHSSEALRVTVDARLPHPPIITCNEPIPLRILIKKLSGSSRAIYLQTVHIELVAYTDIRAHDLRRTESSSWVIATVSNLAKQLGKPEDPAQTEYPVDNVYWKAQPLPNTVAPTFDTCNISRRYELDIRVGVTSGYSSPAKENMIVLPLRHPVQVFSGIAPPQALLAAMAAHLTTGGAQPTGSISPFALTTSTTKPPYPPETPISPLPYAFGPPALGEYAPAAAAAAAAATASSGAQHEGAPPSYEDAIAEELAPVDGRRRDYSVPDVVVSGSGFEKQQQRADNGPMARSDTFGSEYGDKAPPPTGVPGRDSTSTS